jgi:hypothetical protein
MDNDADLESLPALYAQVCAEAGVEPLPTDDLAALAEAMLTGTIAALVTVH